MSASCDQPPTTDTLPPPPRIPRDAGPIVAQALRPTRALRASDTLATAADVLHGSPLPLAPVVHGQAIVGVVGLEDFPGEVASSEPVSTAMRPAPTPLFATQPAAEGLRQMDALGLGITAVIDAHGDLAGLVTRADLFALAGGHARPARCGGMATPLGVYLTTGVARAGVGDFALMLSGAAMGLLALLGIALVYALAWLVDARWNVGALSGFGLGPHGIGSTAWRLAATGTWLVVYALLFRLTPLAGYHAAEHMTVNAIEAGRPLTEEAVAWQSRVHPRCGTNLAVVVIFFSLAGEALAPSGTWLGIVALAVVLSRTSIGGLAQRLVTTRPPTRRELASGIAAGEALVRAHQHSLSEQGTLARRIWCMGLLQSLVGLTSAMVLARVILGPLGLGELLEALP